MVDSESVRLWRTGTVLLMAGHTTGYVMEPRDEYVFGVITERPMRAQRGNERWLVAPGQVLAWDPSATHAGAAVKDRAWSAQLMIIDRDSLLTLGTDEDCSIPSDITFPEPVRSDPDLAAAFARTHTALEGATTLLERDVLLTQWLHAVIARSGVSVIRPPLMDRDDRALQQALTFLRDVPYRNISLEDLAAAAGIGKFRLLHLFRERTGLPPHALQIAYRLRHAQQLLEAGHPIAEAAAKAGFADQSHLHRQFRRSLGMTPGTFQDRIQTARRGPPSQPSSKTRQP